MMSLGKCLGPTSNHSVHSHIWGVCGGEGAETQGRGGPRSTQVVKMQWRRCHYPRGNKVSGGGVAASVGEERSREDFFEEVTFQADLEK